VSWTHCLYDTTAGEDFVIDRRGRLVVVAGTSGHGFKFVPVIGEIAADLALGGEQSRARFRLG
jgi:sarcosine oxidase